MDTIQSPKTPPQMDANNVQPEKCCQKSKVDEIASDFTQMRLNVDRIVDLKGCR